MGIDPAHAICREMKYERGAHAKIAANAHLSTMSLNRVFDNGQAQTGPARFP